MEPWLPWIAIIGPIVGTLLGIGIGTRGERKKAELSARRDALQPINGWLQDLMGFDANVGRTLSQLSAGETVDSAQHQAQLEIMHRLHVVQPRMRGILASSVFTTRATRSLSQQLRETLLDLERHVTKVYLPILEKISSEFSRGGPSNETGQSLAGAVGYLQTQVTKAYSLITDLQTKLN